jgi:hypothetical protein
MYCGSGGIVVAFYISVYCVFVLLCLRVFTSVFFTFVFCIFHCGSVFGGDVVCGGAAGFSVVVVGCGSSGCEMGWLWCLEVVTWCLEVLRW